VPSAVLGASANRENDHYENLLRSTILSTSGSVFSYRNPLEDMIHLRTVNVYQAPASPLRPAVSSGSLSPARKIPTHPAKVLDAPSLADDFYLSVLDWGATNVLAVGLLSDVYLWNASNARVTRLIKDQNSFVCSVVWSPCGTQVAYSDNDGRVTIVDVVTQQPIVTFRDHLARVGCMSWHSSMLATGSRDCSVKVTDIRTPRPVKSWAAHQQEVCGVAWSHCGRYLACGGNDNKLIVWPANHDDVTPLHNFREHESAVRGIAWSPHHHGLLASGGGSADRCIRLWNIKHASSNALQGCVDTGSQVCALSWAQNVDELVSTHGFSSFSVNIWKVHHSTLSSSSSGLLSSSSVMAGSPSASLSAQSLDSMASSSTPGSPSRWPRRPPPIPLPATSPYRPHGSPGGAASELDNSTSSDRASPMRRSGPSEILTPIANIQGHTTRVLYLTASPDGETICTGAGDETLRFWNVFPPKRKSSSSIAYSKSYSPVSSGGPYGPPASPLCPASTELR
jgi:cell division cycle 20-like protein 1 (cofactor of APC complex)